MGFWHIQMLSCLKELLLFLKTVWESFALTHNHVLSEHHQILCNSEEMKARHSEVEFHCFHLFLAADCVFSVDGTHHPLGEPRERCSK